MPGRDLEVEKDRVAAQHAFFKATDTPRIVDGETARSVPGIKSARSATKPKRTEAEVAAYGRKISDFADWCATTGMPISDHHHMAAAIKTEAEL